MSAYKSQERPTGIYHAAAPGRQLKGGQERTNNMPDSADVLDAVQPGSGG